ncbi:MAG: hypothetical protein AB1744_04500 [Candidatus Zixiibacteriota bacterium]
MKRILTISFALLLLMSVSSFATNTRVLTMGDNNTILLDEANIWQFPSRINDYPNLAIAEFADAGGSEFKDFGIHWRFNQDYPWVLGTYFHNSDVIYPMSSPFRSYYPFPFGYNPEFVPFDAPLMSNQRIDLFYGRKLGVQQVPFGFRFSLVNSSWKSDIPDNQDEEGFSIYDFAFGLTVGGGMTDLAAGVMFMTWTDHGTNPADSTAYDETKPKGNYLLYGSARHFWQVTPTYTVVPHADLYVGKNEAEYYALVAGQAELQQSDTYNWFGFEVGTGLQYAPSNDAMAVIDFGFQYQKLDGDFDNAATGLVEASSKTLTIPFFRAGADLKVFNWMDARFGATSYWDRNTLEADLPDDFTMNYANNETYLGFGFHWGNLHVDTYTDPEVFLNGFDFLTGQSSSDFNFRLSALYEIM